LRRFLFMQLALVDTLCELVRIPSINPMGRMLSGDIYYEHKVTDYLEKLFLKLGWPHVRQSVSPLRDNIVARINGDIPPERGGKIVVLEAHQDTVPIEGMTIDPFIPEIRDGKIYGRGACDIKGGMASILHAAARLHAESTVNRPTVIVACTVNEEHGFTGAKALANAWKAAEDSPMKRLVPHLPDAVIVSEPTLLNVVAAHKGVVRWRCDTLGRAGHSSQPQLGDNAIYRMGEVLHWLEIYAQTIVGNLQNHALVGQPTLSVGVISGGISVNTVPDCCTIEIDRRLVPIAEDSPHFAQQHVIEYLKQKLPPSLKLVHSEPYIQSPGLSNANNQHLVAHVSNIAQVCGAPGQKIGVPYGTDAPAYDRLGIPTIVFGPGSIAQAHTCNEWVEISQLEQASEVYYRLVKEWV
jgi:acetylornithine deacetylase/succinyl-diaminopimelate desuccinylase-like protein